MRTRQYDGVDSSEHLKGVKKHCIKLAIKITLLRGSRTDWLASVWVVCSVVRFRASIKALVFSSHFQRPWRISRSSRTEEPYESEIILRVLAMCHRDIKARNDVELRCASWVMCAKLLRNKRAAFKLSVDVWIKYCKLSFSIFDLAYSVDHPCEPPQLYFLKLFVVVAS